jgi:prolyl oligopeptidase
MKKFLIILFLLGSFCLAAADRDPFAWLEEIDGRKAIDWVKVQNTRTLKELTAVAEYRPIFEKTLQILDSKERIPYPSLHGGHLYNFWKDAAHERGIWRRTTLASYRTADPQWETVIDVDALAKKDGIPWTWGGASFLEPENRRCLVSLARGGSDAVVIREFDAREKAFVAGGFSLPEAKSESDWYDADTLWVSTDFGPGSLTASGYPRIVKLWKRGTPLAEARTIFEGKPEDVSVGGYTIVDLAAGRRYHFITRTPIFYKQETFLRLDERLVKIEIPEDANIDGIFQDRLLVSLRTPWPTGGKTYPAGGLLAIGLDAFLQGSRACEELFTPGSRVFYAGVATTASRLYLFTLDNVRTRIHVLTPGADGWTRAEFPLPGLGTVEIVTLDREKEIFFYTYTDFLTPVSLYLSEAGRSEKIKSQPAFFDAAGMTVAQQEAVSRDGTRIPYFVVTPKSFVADGNAPTLLYGYGGFENSELPYYSSVKGAAWLERGGVYALANIRGGGEFGPDWHQQALQKNRIKSFEDFIAVAEDLVARKITSTKHLGIMGGSQGGLLVGGCFTMRPDLFAAVVAQVPLADMRRYHKLLAGASWMGEYGNPDKPEDWAYIQTWSPYHLLKKGVTYPKVFFWTNTRDDRVHPAHARKMVARMLEQGHPVYYFENIEGGHGFGSTNRQTAQVNTLEYAYLWKMLR